MFLKIKFLNEITIILIKLLFFDNTFKHHIIENQIQDVFLRKNLTESKRNSDAGSHGYCSTDYGVCARYKNVKFSLYPRLGFSQKASWSRWTSPKTEAGGAVGEAIFHVSMPRNTDNRRVSQSCAAAFATVFVPCAHGTRGHDRALQHRSEQQPRLQQIKNRRDCPDFHRGAWKSPRRIFHEMEWTGRWFWEVYVIL